MHEALETPFPISVLILAGGYSRRMGEDKALLPFGDQTALERLLSVACAISDDVLVIRRPDQPVLPAVSRCHIVHDLRPGQGPLAGIEAGLHAARHLWCLVLPVDAPGVTREFVNALLSVVPVAQAAGELAVITTEGVRTHPLHAVYHKTVEGIIGKLMINNRRKVLELLAEIPWRACPQGQWARTDQQGLAVHPCNTPEEAQGLRERLHG